jgi:hypothetical protein
MSYPTSWIEEPPEIPGADQVPGPAYVQYVASLRKMAKNGELSAPFDAWLFDYERLHPPRRGASTYVRMHEKNTSSERSFELNQEPEPLPEGAQVARAEGQRLDHVLQSVSHSITELRLGFTSVLHSLKAGYEEIRVGNQQLQADQRAFLGLLFPQMEGMMTQSIESMGAYRKSVLAEAQAVSATKAAQLGNDGATGEAEKAIVGMLTEVAKTKMLEVMSPKPAPAPAAPQTPEAPK